ncbi:MULTISPECIES: hypothetical protein [Reichenbachiella]|uniref:Uncharacterized protein n=1 Tax=Reichenbachiella agariperforans TaxID=156994 RepID=A0A1M6R1X3_REIAG|nr:MULTISPECIES: hypothetical protein [Reichenbachiella]SHK26442.1 hypothetical protein SAMN04488028_10411 [Reichenbachiella agariperforans]
MKKARKSIVPTLIAGVTATVLGLATYSIIKNDRVVQKVNRVDSKKKQERMFI